jgi:acetyl-CoA C-acetyltransferase
MMSLQRAKSLEIDENRMVYLHGCGDANDIWDISDRINYHSSPAIRRIGEEALEMAGKTIDDIDYLDIYSCFPSAVQIACDELGIAHDDPRGLTVTGGLPYFGGPGNNYTMHAIAEMMNTLRANPGKYGLLNANGWFITKHSLGIYSTSPIKTPWKRKDPTSYQQELLDQESPNFVAEANGNATIETFTVLFDRTGPEHGIVIGRLDSGNRFIAKTKQDNAIFHTMTKGNIIGKDGTVECVDGVNIFSF